MFFFRYPFLKRKHTRLSDSGDFIPNLTPWRKCFHRLKIDRNCCGNWGTDGSLTRLFLVVFFLWFAFCQGKPDCLGKSGVASVWFIFYCAVLSDEQPGWSFSLAKWRANAKGGEGGSAPSSLEMANFLLDDDKLNAFLVNWQHAGFLENGAWKLECISYWQWGYASQLCYFTRGYDPPGGWWTFFACSDSQKIDGKEKSWNWRSVQESNAMFWMSNKIWSDMEIYFDYNFAFEKRWKALVILHVYHVCWSFF